MEAMRKLYDHDNLGKLILRLTVGGLMLFHGIGKLRGGVDGIAGMVEGQGLPRWIAYGVYVGEVVAPALMIIGFWTRPAALVLAINMVAAVAMAHRNDLIALNEIGIWKLELQAFYFFGALAVFFLGAGRFSVSGATGARMEEAPVEREDRGPAPPAQRR